MVMKHKDGTLYSCLSGVAFDGPKKGARLTPVPTVVSDWGFVLDRYPQAVAYHMFDKYKPVDLPEGVTEESKKSRGPADERLAADKPVFGVWDGGKARAFPLDAVEKAGVLADKVGDRDCVVLWYGPTKTAAAYVPVAAHPKQDVGRQKVTLSLDPKGGAAPFVDKETGSHWDVTGRAVEGDLKGWELEWLDGVQVKWFAWAAEYPDATVYGQ